MALSPGLSRLCGVPSLCLLVTTLMAVPSLQTTAELPDVHRSAAFNVSSRDLADNPVNDTTTLSKRMPPHTPQVIDPFQQQEAGGWLSRLMWDNVDEAETLYHNRYRGHSLERQTLQKPIPDHFLDLRYWTRDQNVPAVINAFYSQHFQDVYQHLGPIPPPRSTKIGKVLTPPPAHGPHVFIEWINSKPGPTASRKDPTEARCKFVLNVPCGIIVIQRAQSPFDLAHQKFPDKDWQEIDASLPAFPVWSDVLYTEWDKQHLRQAHELSWKWWMTKTEIEEAQGLLKWIVMERVAALQTLQIVRQCLTTRGHGPQTLPQYPGETFLAGDKCFDQFLSIPPNDGIAWFLAEHKVQLGHLMLESVQVYTLDAPTGDQYPTFVWKVVEFKPELAQAAKDREAAGLPDTPPGGGQGAGRPEHAAPQAHGGSS